MFDVTFTCRGYDGGVIGELEYPLDRSIGDISFSVINLSGDLNPVAHLIRIDATSSRTATLTWDGGSPLAGPYLMSLFVINADGATSDPMRLRIEVDKNAPVVVISKLIGGSVDPAPINRIHTPSASLSTVPVATANSIYVGTPKAHTFHLNNAYKSSRKYTINSTTGEIFYNTTKPAISRLTVDRDDITVDIDVITCDATTIASDLIVNTSPCNTSALVADGDHFSTPNPFTTSAAQGWSLFGWVKLDSFGSTFNTVFSDASSSTSYKIILRYHHGSQTMRLSCKKSGSGETHVVSTFGPMSTGVWYFVGASYSVADGYKVVVNNTVTNSTSSVQIDPSNTLYIGIWRTGSTWYRFDGSICLSGAYNRALSDVEWGTLYNSGSPVCYNTLDYSQKTGLAALWNLGYTSDDSLPSGDEVIDQSGNSKHLTNVGGVPFTGSGQSVACSGDPTKPLDGTIHEIEYHIIDSLDSWCGTTKFVYKDTTFIGGLS